MATQIEIEAVLHQLERCSVNLDDPVMVILVPGGKSSLSGTAGWDPVAKRWRIVLDSARDFKTVAHTAFHEFGHIMLGHVQKLEFPGEVSANVEMMRGKRQWREAVWAKAREAKEYREREEVTDCFAQEMFQELWPELQEYVKKGGRPVLSPGILAWARKARQVEKARAWPPRTPEVEIVELVAPAEMRSERFVQWRREGKAAKIYGYLDLERIAESQIAVLGT